MGLEELVNRKLDKKTRNVLHNIGQLIDKLVDQGGVIYSKINEKQYFDEFDLPIHTLMIQTLNLIDAISILTKKGQTDGIKSCLRSLFETSLNLRYMIRNPKEKGVLAYTVSYARRKIQQRELLDFKTEKGKEFIRKAKQKFSDFEIESTPLEESTKNLIKFLERDEVKPVNDEWERTKKKYKKNPHWYSLFDGPSNLRELSKLLSLEVIYDILYTDLSGYVHASDSINQIKVTDNLTAVIPGIRDFSNLQSEIMHTLNITLDLFLDLINTYIPEFKVEFARWYIKNVQEEMNRIISNKPLFKIKYDPI